MMCVSGGSALADLIRAIKTVQRLVCDAVCSGDCEK